MDLLRAYIRIHRGQPVQPNRLDLQAAPSVGSGGPLLYFLSIVFDNSPLFGWRSSGGLHWDGDQEWVTLSVTPSEMG